MITSNTPRLCGGTFFVLLLRAKRNRTKKDIQKYGNGGVTNPEMLTGLIQFFDPEYVAPLGSSLATNTSLYKACEISYADCLPFTDTALLNSFDGRVRNSYLQELAKMKLFADFFLTTEKPEKVTELVYGILNLIKDDESIEENDIFFASSNSVAINKSNLLYCLEINLYSLLLGVWHFILLHRSDNSIGKLTIENWFEKPKEKGDRHIFVSTIGNSYHLDIKISTLCPETDDAGTNETNFTDEAATEFVSSEDVIDIPHPQIMPSVNQTIHNQFNINQNGNGINIGYAEKIEIRDGKVVKLK